MQIQIRGGAREAKAHLLQMLLTKETAAACIPLLLDAYHYIDYRQFNNCKTILTEMLFLMKMFADSF